MGSGKAEMKITKEVNFFDWNRYNVAATTALAQWCQGFGDDVNKHFGVNQDNNGLTILTPMGEHVDVNPGSIILRSSDGQYSKTSPGAFDRKYQVIEEGGIKIGGDE